LSEVGVEFKKMGVLLSLIRLWGVVIIVVTIFLVGGVGGEKTLKVNVWQMDNPWGISGITETDDYGKYQEIIIRWVTPLIIYATFVFAPAPFVLLFFILRVYINIASNFLPI